MIPKVKDNAYRRKRFNTGKLRAQYEHVLRSIWPVTLYYDCNIKYTVNIAIKGYMKSAMCCGAAYFSTVVQ